MSQTACPHCGSTNSFETAGQRYCADCGQLITEKKSTKKHEAKVEVKTAKPASKPKVVASKAPAAKPKKAAPPLNLKAIEESRNPKAPAQPRPGVLDLKNPSPKPAVKKPVGKHVAPKQVEKPQPAEPIISEPPIDEAPIAEVRVPVQTKKFHHKQALREALKGVFTARLFSATFVAVFVIAVAKIVYVTIFAKSGLYAITESVAAGSVNVARATTIIDHIAWMILIGILGYLVYQYVIAKIIYKVSTSYDRVNEAHHVARHTALGSLFGLTLIDIITAKLFVLVLLLAAGANYGFLGTKSLGVMGVVLAVAVNLIAAYVCLGLVAARQMSVYAVVLGQESVHRSYSIGWSMYMRQFGLITNGLITMALVSALIAMPAALVYAVVGISTTVTLAATLAVAALTATVLIIMMARYFAQLYQYVIAKEFDNELAGQLSGRNPRKAHVGRRLVALGFVVAIWVVVATSLILSSTPVATALIR